VSLPSLTDSTSSPPPTEVSNDGWFINLALPDGTSKAERMITNPLPLPSGNVLFTTFSPSSDVCGLGGTTFLWAVGYNTGGIPVSGSISGKAFVQVSSGGIQEVDLRGTFSGGQIVRKIEVGPGIPSKGQGLTAVVNPAPIKKILHIQER
jgi:type IV pilus assembly protein PilY1